MRVGKKNPSLSITVCHHSASLMMPIGDPQEGFFFPTLTHMIDSYKTHTEYLIGSLRVVVVSRRSRFQILGVLGGISFNLKYSVSN